MAGALNRFYQWIHECCKELNWPIERGADLVEDPNWFACFDDGMSATEAVQEAVGAGIVKPTLLN